MTNSEIYNINPTRCKHCSQPILHTHGKLCDTLRKQFCTQRCAATYNNKHTVLTLTGTCKLCQQVYTKTGRNNTMCASCRNRSRYTIKVKLKRDVSKDAINSHARYLMKTEPKLCRVCGYDFYVEVCHIQPVASFPPETPLTEINEKTNLVYLCPNHHKELDRGKLYRGDLVG